MMDCPTASLSLQHVIFPFLDELNEKEGKDVTSALKDAFNKVEKQNMGFAQSFVSGACQQEPGIDVTRSVLSLAAKPCPDYAINRSEVEFKLLCDRASHLKTILSRIPQEISDRSVFLQTIKDIAGAIRDVLEAINSVSKAHGQLASMPKYKKALDHEKKLFVKTSKSFSDTLKKFFKDSRANYVFASANSLCNQTNTLLQLFKVASQG
ncbi:programmed cell death protein 10-A-like [Sycon ciliatum]|uniref:programmed cell death protein 10-A-like n=1 Tax=Sycon ciliatum TaxID=27933 RepID=UPI0020A852FF|eukprot:scpid64295/ scgid6298/ Programmed cell death protein 10-A